MMYHAATTRLVKRNKVTETAMIGRDYLRSTSDNDADTAAAVSQPLQYDGCCRHAKLRSAARLRALQLTQSFSGD